MDARQLMKKAERNLHRVVAERAFWTPAFCRVFFDWCDGQAYEHPDAAIRRADLALELARKTNDRHMLARAHGVLASAYRIRSLYAVSAEEFERAFAYAGSCSCCLADTYRRQGILLMFQHAFEASIALYDKALSHYRVLHDEDGVGRTLVSRGISLWKLERLDEALEAERVALRLLAPDSPTVYHSAALANIAQFLATADDRYFVHAEHYCREFRRYFAGREGFTAVRVRLRWSHGLILVRLGERKRGIQMLRKVRDALIRSRLDVEVIAITADIARAYCDTNKFYLIVSLARDTLARVDDILGTRALLEQIVAAAQRELVETRHYIAKLRDAVVVSIPCLLGADALADTFATP